MSYPTKAEVVNVIRRKLESKNDWPLDMQESYKLGILDAATAVQAMIWRRHA